MYSKLYVCSFFVLTFVCRKEKLPYLISMDSIRMRSICKAENQRLIHDHTRCDLLLLLLLLKMIAIHWTYHTSLLFDIFLFYTQNHKSYKGRASSIFGKEIKKKKKNKNVYQNTCLMQLDSIGPAAMTWLSWTVTNPRTFARAFFMTILKEDIETIWPPIK